MFPYDGDFMTSTASWPKLLQQLFRLAAENGYHLRNNGGFGTGQTVKFCIAVGSEGTQFLVVLKFMTPVTTDKVVYDPIGAWVPDLMGKKEREKKQV